MADFRAMLSGLGFSNVATLLNSGNAVFSAAKGTSRSHAAAIAGCISDQLKLDVPVLVKSAQELAAIVQGNPIAQGDFDPSRLLVVFAADEVALKGLEPIKALAKAPDKFHIGAHAAYAYCAQGSLVSPVGAALLGKQGSTVTTRNWATTLKLHALASAA